MLCKSGRRRWMSNLYRFQVKPGSMSLLILRVRSNPKVSSVTSAVRSAFVLITHGSSSTYICTKMRRNQRTEKTAYVRQSICGCACVRKFYFCFLCREYLHASFARVRACVRVCISVCLRTCARRRYTVRSHARERLRIFVISPLRDGMPLCACMSRCICIPSLSFRIACSDT